MARTSRSVELDSLSILVHSQKPHTQVLDRTRLDDERPAFQHLAIEHQGRAAVQLVEEGIVVPDRNDHFVARMDVDDGNAPNLTDLPDVVIVLLDPASCERIADSVVRTCASCTPRAEIRPSSSCMRCSSSSVNGACHSSSWSSGHFAQLAQVRKSRPSGQSAQILLDSAQNPPTSRRRVSRRSRCSKVNAGPEPARLSNAPCAPTSVLCRLCSSRCRRFEASSRASNSASSRLTCTYKSGLGSSWFTWWLTVMSEKDSAYVAATASSTALASQGRPATARAKYSELTERTTLEDTAMLVLPR